MREPDIPINQPLFQPYSLKSAGTFELQISIFLLFHREAQTGLIGYSLPLKLTDTSLFSNELPRLFDPVKCSR